MLNYYRIFILIYNEFHNPAEYEFLEEKSGLDFRLFISDYLFFDWTVTSTY